LAAELQAVGIPWNRMIVTNFESPDGKRRNAVTVEEFLALAYVLSVQPAHLLVPIDASETTPYAITPAGSGHSIGAHMARAWFRGLTPVAEVEAKRYFTEVPDAEWSPPAGQWTPGNVAAQSAAVAKPEAERRERRGNRR
jgi:hypothetical protein